MALSVDTPRSQRSRDAQSYKVKNAEQLYFGSLVGILPSTGLLQKWADTATLLFKGICQRKTLGDTSATPVVEAPVDESGPVLEGVTVAGIAGTVADVGDPVYATDDGTLTITATTNVKAIGRINRQVSSTTCDVKLFTPEEFFTQN